VTQNQFHTFTTPEGKTYTSARNYAEAVTIHNALEYTTGREWTISEIRDWMTGSPNCWLIEMED
jgi:hypothetical protein